MFQKAFVFAMLAFVVACTGSPGASVVVTQEPAGANCAAGGAKVQVGSETPTYVCNGAAGQSATVVTEPPGSNCAMGGVKVQVGGGAATYVCTGATGAAGQSVAVASEPAGANCATGGVKVQVGAGTPAFVCNGAAGSNGESVAATPESAGSHCAAGGVKLQVGSGAATYVCNGADGSAGQSATVTAELPGDNCTAGGLKVQVGAAAPSYVCNGTDGASGLSADVSTEPPGDNCAAGGLKVQVGAGAPSYVCNGVDGSSCSIVELPMSLSLTCPDLTGMVLQPKFSVGGSIAGLVGPMTLKLNGGHEIFLPGTNNFTFPWGLFDGASYQVTIEGYSLTQDCDLVADAGTIDGANVTDVEVNCACNTGLADCDLNGNNGCETDIMTDPANCGGCNLPCASGEVCDAGACVTPPVGVVAAASGTR